MSTISSFPRRACPSEGRGGNPLILAPFLDSGSPLRCGRNDEFSCRINKSEHRLLYDGSKLEPTNMLFSQSMSSRRRGAKIQTVSVMNKQFFVYILASKRNGTLYTGITSDLVKRVWQHKNNSVEGFTKKYNVKILVYYETYNDAESAITREKRIKKWRRAWKLRLIEEKNPHWKDLYDEII